MVSWCNTNPPSLPDAGTVQVSVSSHGYGYRPIVLATVQRSFQLLLYGRGDFSTISLPFAAVPIRGAPDHALCVCALSRIWLRLAT